MTRDADPSLLAFASPLAHPLHFVGLELVFAACFALTIGDAALRYRRGDRYALFQWLVVFAYGVAMELIAFNAYPDYEHGQFTVQLYHRKLPLYVTFVYVVIHYTSLQLVARLRLRAVAEAVTAGLAMVLFDVPFDIAGVDARWWTWTPSSRDVAQRWLGVPLTSFEWYLLFGAVLVGACRLVRPRVERRSVLVYALLAPAVALAVIVAGIVGFLPFHALEALGVPDSALVGVHAGVALAIAVFAPAVAVPRAPRSLAIVPVVLGAWHLGVLALLWQEGVASQGATKLGVSAVAVGMVVGLFV
ncbi:MAG TPA: hypothetical protein VIF09_06125, partial [Polyangiaceae bacterium]